MHCFYRQHMNASAPGFLCLFALDPNENETKMKMIEMFFIEFKYATLQCLKNTVRSIYKLVEFSRITEDTFQIFRSR